MTKKEKMELLLAKVAEGRTEGSVCSGAARGKIQG